MQRTDLKKSMAMAMAMAMGMAMGMTIAPLNTAAAQSERSDWETRRDRSERVSEASYPQDPADEAYREARDALNRGEYRRAARDFRRLRDRYPSSAYVGDSYYWEAFSLYRNGRDDDLRVALDALAILQEEHSDARTARDAETLETRVQGELARRGDARAAEDVTRSASFEVEVQEGGECPGDDEIRIAAMNALLQMSAEQALPILEKVLERRDECSVELRRKAVFLVAQHVDDESVDILIRVVNEDPDLEVRRQAVFWLSQVSTEEALDALEGILRESPDREMQERAIFAISQHGSARAARILKEYAMQSSAARDLREKAIFWIGQHSSAENAQFLRELYESTDDVGIKERIVFSLSQMGGRGNADWLLEIAVDPDEPIEVRKKAIFWAGQSSGISIARMTQLYDRMPDRELKEQMIFALSQRSEDEAVDKLIDIARNEQDRDLRKKAIFWLSQTNDPRVAELLLELIEQ